MSVPTLTYVRLELRGEPPEFVWAAHDLERLDVVEDHVLVRVRLWRWSDAPARFGIVSRWEFDRSTVIRIERRQ